MTDENKHVIKVAAFDTLNDNGRIYPFNSSTMSINGIQAKRIINNTVKADGKEYIFSSSVFNEYSLEFTKEISALFDDLVTPAVEPNDRLVKNVDEWIKRVHELKMKYGVPAFMIMYDGVERIRSLMWGEGYTEEDAVVEVANRQEKEIQELLARRTQRVNQLKGSLNHPHEKIIKMVREFDASVPGNLDGHHFISDFHVGMGRGICINTNKGSGGHGYDISTNGRGHKKVVTGKAGNRYPVAKRKGVR